MQIHSSTTAFTSTAGVTTNTTVDSAFGVNPIMLNYDRMALLLNEAPASVITITADIGARVGVAANPLAGGSCWFSAAYNDYHSHVRNQLASPSTRQLDYEYSVYGNVENIAPNAQGIISFSTASSKPTKMLLFVRNALPMSAAITDQVFTNTNNIQASNITAANSPYTSCPYTVRSHASLSDVSIQVGGGEYFRAGSESRAYDWYQRLISMYSLANGKNNTVSSGLISYHDFIAGGYGVYCVDMTESDTPAEWSLPKAIKVQFTNSTNSLISVSGFLLEQRTVKLDVNTGKIIR